MQTFAEKNQGKGTFSTESTTSVQRKASATVQRKSNGLPTQLKSGIESLSGISMDDVTVHYNSSKPAQMKALAYTQGTDIHVAPGQEQHLGHEAWHVVQQKQGRVQPTTQMKGVNVNDDSALEHEADVMGSRAVQMKAISNTSAVQWKKPQNEVAQMKNNSNTVQMVREDNKFGFFKRTGRIIHRALFKDKPRFVYRIDDRSPEQIKEAGGFKPRNQNSTSTLLEHVIGHDIGNSGHNTRNEQGFLNTNFVSTSGAKAYINQGQAFGGLMTGDRYIYKINTEGGDFLDVLDTLDRDGSQDAANARLNFKSQREWASKGEIKYEKIVGWQKLGTFLGNTILDKDNVKTEEDVHNAFDGAAMPMP